jgi:RNA polymerase sigma factor (TIGR02999 family)
MNPFPAPPDPPETGDAGQQTVTRLLQELRTGNRQAFSDLLPRVYDELHELARKQRGRWEGNETLNPTALVHEAYLRMAELTAPQWVSRPHFLAVAATAMRQILLDYAKRMRAAKRGGGQRPIPLHEVEDALRSNVDLSSTGPEALLALDEALRRLELHDRRQSRIVECRFFGGMTIEETAEALGISPATVSRGWAMAQAWLYRELKQALDAP